MSVLEDKKYIFRTQFDGRLPVPDVVFPPSIVQRGQSPSISQIVKTRRVGGNELDEYQMDGILENAEFDSEYLDYFDLQDMAQAEAERQASQPAPADAGEPPTNEPPTNPAPSDAGG